MVLGTLCLALLAQGAGPVLAGRVVDAAGEPLKGAEVGVGCHAEAPGGSFELLAEARAGEGGAFRLELPAEWLRRVGYRDPVLLALAPGHGLYAQGFELRELPLGVELELRLPPDPGSSVRIVDPGGQPVAGAEVAVLAILDDLGRTQTLPAGWWEERASATDAGGRAALALPLEAIQRLRVLAPGHAPHVFWPDRNRRMSLPNELHLLAPPALTIDWGAGEPPPSPLSIKGHFELSDGQPGGVECEWQVVLEAPGPQRSPGPTERRSLRLDAPGASALPWSWDREGGSAHELVLAREETYSVRGRVVDAKSGDGLPGVRLRIHAGTSSGWVVSGPDGSYGFEVGEAAGWIRGAIAPPGHLSAPSLEGPRFARPPDGGEVDLGELELHPTQPITGLVSDATGAPVAGAFVLGTARVSTGTLRQEIRLAAVTGGTGGFVLEGAPLGADLELLARHGGAEGMGAARAGGRVELTLVPRLAARGRLLDEDDAPVAGARIELWRASPRGFVGGERRLSLAGRAHLLSGAGGGFESPAELDPDLRYALRVAGPGVEELFSGWREAGELARGVELRLRRRESLGGVLRGPGGEPLAGVALRLRRGGARAVTDADGRFVLEEVPVRGDVLIAEAPGEEVPHARWVEPGEALDWRLSAREGARPPELAEELDRARELELALELLEAQYEEALASGDGGRLLGAVQRLAPADPAGALERVEGEIFRAKGMRDQALSSIADALRWTSPEEALAVARRMSRGMGASLSALRSAGHLAPAAEREQLALLRAEARAIERPEHRVVVLARLAGRLHELGEHEAAAAVLEEGRELAARLPAAGWPAYARGRFAEVLSLVDYGAARALIDELRDPSAVQRHLGNMAHRLAAQDPERAEALLGELTRPRAMWNAGSFASRVAYSMAPVDLERARAIAERYDRSGFSDGMIALALVESREHIGPAASAEQALRSLETAFRRAEDPRHQDVYGRSSWVVAAALLPVAERVDPGGFERWMARALAVRRPGPDGTLMDEARGWLADATLALHLARWDRELPRRLLEPALEASEVIESAELEHRREVLWAALAVVDPEWAARLAREQGGSAALLIARLLAMPPDERTRYVQEQILKLWVAGKDDL